MVARLLKGRHLGQIRFDIAIRNAIRRQRHSGGTLMPMPREFATKTQSETPEPFSSLQPEPPKSLSPRPEPPRWFKRVVKSFLLLVLTPFKPPARLVRRFLLAPIADQITSLNARTDLLFNEVQAVQGQLQAVHDRTQNLIQDRTQYLISLLKI